MAREAADAGATVVAFPEQVIGGYPTEDLVLWNRFVEAQWKELERFAKATEATGAVFAAGLTVIRKQQRYNCAALVHRGSILGIVPKEKLPSYNVFYEGRTCMRGAPGLSDRVHGVPFGDLVFRFDFGVLAVDVCEDIWSPDGPLRRRSFAGATLALNLSASPYRIAIQQTRREMLATRSADCQVALLYVNSVGANDSLIFDGGGYIFQNGRLELEAERFREGIAAVTVDLDRTGRRRAENSTFRLDFGDWDRAGAKPQVVRPDQELTREDPIAPPVPAGKSFFVPAKATTTDRRAAFCEELLTALALGLGDYFEKTGAFQRIGVALSGGRDSLLTLLVAHRYLEQSRHNIGETLCAFTMPSHVTSDETKTAATTICRELGVNLATVPIADAYEREVEALRKMLPQDQEPDPLTLQNIQARIRGTRMWNWANTRQGLWLHTGNMSEKSVGYTTIGGDLEGGLSILSNVPKTVVFCLLGYLLEKTGLEGIRLTLDTIPGPELEPDQSGEEELMPFAILDACFYLYAGEKMAPGEVLVVLREMFPDEEPDRLAGHVEKFTRLFTRAIYKWVQSPLSLHVGNLDLERERALQIPVVQKLDWTDDD